MKISTSILDKLSYIYISVPLFIFLIFWLKPALAVVSILLLVFCLKEILKKIPNSSFFVDKKIFITIAIITSIWCILAGIGGLAYQSPDWHVRNAIFRDLVDFSFPVQYENGTMLVYYMGLFLSGALFSKIFLFLGNDFAFKIGNYFTLLYVIVGINLIVLEIIRFTKAQKKQQLIVLLIFILFSGIDVFEPNIKINFITLHLERHGALQYSCNTTLLFWVYNQAIMPWLISILFLRHPYKIQNFGFLAVSALFYSPLAFCAIAFYFFAITLFCFIKSIKTKKIKHFFKKIFSKSNLLILPIFFIIFLYFKSNATVNNDGFSIILDKNNTTLAIKTLKTILLFIFLEAGVYFVPIFHKYKNNLVFKITVFLLCAIPFFEYSNCADFCMRASIPPLIILMIFVIKYLLQKNNKIIKTLLIIVLLLGSITPVVEIFRSCVHTLFAKRYTLVKDNIKTYNNKIYKENCRYEVISGNSILSVGTNYCNYGSINPKQYFFFKYISK